MIQYEVFQRNQSLNVSAGYMKLVSKIGPLIKGNGRRET